jgi:hypothetical protein
MTRAPTGDRRMPLFEKPELKPGWRHLSPDPPTAARRLERLGFDSGIVGRAAGVTGDGCRTALKPDHLDIGVGFGLQPTARPNPVQVAVDVDLIAPSSGLY